MIKDIILSILIFLEGIFQGVFGLSHPPETVVIAPHPQEMTTTQKSLSSSTQIKKDKTPLPQVFITPIPTSALPVAQKLNTLPTTSPSVDVALTTGDIIAFTNVERQKAGVKTLSWNDTLTTIAVGKAKDMLARQYFEHMSPDGKNISALAEDAGYAYLLVGENLAEGDFASSADVVDGWMHSPGHRENILKPEYTEMGAAAVRGTYKGYHIWMAVQEFGKPMPVCENPDVDMKNEITREEEEITALAKTLSALQIEISSAPTVEIANEYITEYNNALGVYKKKSDILQENISLYNTEVNNYNVCIHG